MLEPINIIEILIKSCEEGHTGKWDCSTDEGKEGFQSMIELLVELKTKIKE